MLKRIRIKSIAAKWAIYAAILLIFGAIFAYNRDQEPYFIDEGAYLAQSYYYRLLKEGKLNHVDWLHQASYDYMNVGRTMVGASLDLQGYKVPESIEGMERWYGGDGTTPERDPPADWGMLQAARLPMIVGGAIGCLCAFVLAKQLVGFGTGIIAATLLAMSPLYYTYSRRAMADIWVEAFLLAGFAIMTFLARFIPHVGRRYVIVVGGLFACLAGLMFGLSAGSKLNGAIGLIALLLGSGLIVGLSAPWRNSGPSHACAKRFGALTLIAVVVAGLTFYVTNPFLYAHPVIPPGDDIGIEIDGKTRSREWLDKYVRPLADSGPFERMRYMIEYRDAVLQDMAEKNRFPDDTLPTVGARLSSIVTEGLGRWSYPSTLGLSAPLSWIVPLVLSLLGLCWCIDDGRRKWSIGLLPVSWLMVSWVAVELIVLSRELTLDWDRYYLGIIVQTSLLSALGIGGTIQWIGRKLILLPPDAPPLPDSEHG